MLSLTHLGDKISLIFSSTAQMLRRAQGGRHGEHRAPVEKGRGRGTRWSALRTHTCWEGLWVPGWESAPLMVCSTPRALGPDRFAGATQWQPDALQVPERPPTSIFFRFLASRMQTVSFPAVGT